MRQTLEFIKTGVLLLLAIGMTSLAVYVTNPKWFVGEADPEEILGQFFSFKPLTATSLSIVSYDEGRAALEEFQVERNADGEWVIPSRNNYPADAADQLAEAASEIRSLTRLERVTDRKSNHEQLGVIDPIDHEPGQEGLGTRVTLKTKGETLADLIIGKEDQLKKGQYYVRLHGEDHVYQAEIDMEPLSTDFHKWIEVDLLEISGHQIKTVTYFNYSFNRTAYLQVQDYRQILDQLKIFQLDYTPGQSSTWNLKDVDLQTGQATPAQIPPEQELDQNKLSTMRSGLIDLKIEDVRRKPGNLDRFLAAIDDVVAKIEEVRSNPQAPALTAPNLQSLFQTVQSLINQQSVQELFERGFFVPLQPLPEKLGFRGGSFLKQGRTTQDDVFLFGQDGEMVIQQDDGVYYVLKFGELIQQTGSAKPGSEEDGATEQEKPQRYLLIQAGFDPEVLPKPEREPILDQLKTTDPSQSPGDQPADDQPMSTQPGSSEGPVEGPMSTQPGESAIDPPSPAEPPASADKTPAKNAAQEVLRQRAQQRFQKEQEQYAKKLEEGRKRAARLNRRFRGWYYVIDGEVFEKIGLKREELLKDIEKPQQNQPPSGPGLGAPFGSPLGAPNR